MTCGHGSTDCAESKKPMPRSGAPPACLAGEGLCSSLAAHPNADQIEPIGGIFFTAQEGLYVGAGLCREWMAGAAVAVASGLQVLLRPRCIRLERRERGDAGRCRGAAL